MLTSQETNEKLRLSARDGDMIALGADVEYPADGPNPLMLAVRGGQTEIIKVLANEKLKSSVLEGDLENVEKMIALGADVEAQKDMPKSSKFC